MKFKKNVMKIHIEVIEFKREGKMTGRVKLT